MKSQLLEKIQNALLQIECDDALSISIRNMAASDPDKAANFVMQCHKENPLMLDEMLGKELITDVYDYIEPKPKTMFSDEELDALDEEDPNDHDRRYHR